MLRVIGCVGQEHDLTLVLLAAFLCALASVTTFSMLLRAQRAGAWLRTAWHAGAAFAFGSGVWTTHFVAMLAFEPGIPVGFDVPMTAMSLLLACVGSWPLLGVPLRRRGGTGLHWSVLAGALLGADVGAMHFVGMDAMRIPGLVSWNLGIVAESLALGSVFGALSLAAFHRGGWTGTGAACACMVLAITGLHFTAMAAVSIAPLAAIGTGANGAAAAAASGAPRVAAGMLAVSAAAVSLMVLLVSLTLTLLDQYLHRRWAAESGRLHRFANSTFEGILFHRAGLVSDANGPMCELLGLPANAVVGRPVGDFLAAAGGPQAGAMSAAATVAGKPSGPDRRAGGARASAAATERRLPPAVVLYLDGAVEAELVVADGSRRSVELLNRELCRDGGRTMVTAVRDLSDRKQAERHIQQLAHYDPLTGLANRTLFRDRLAQALALAGRTSGGVALLLLDLDGFKVVNDLMGHPVGDRLLVEVGNRLTMSVREMDTVARLGGDEFAVIQPMASQPETSEALARRIVQTLSEPFVLEGRKVSIGTSVGIAIYPTDAHAPEMLMRDADMALYRAKEEGRGTWRFFEQGMDLRLQERRRLEQDLRQGLERGEFHLHYQPLFDSISLRIDGYEALVRWQHPARGRVPPGEFVPLAEECGFIVPLGSWVLEAACAEAATWPQPHRIAVNLSPAQFRSRGLAEQVADILARTGLDPARLELEITEGVLIADPEAALAALRALKGQGVRIALDDFGTGYSSLGYLRRFPFDKIKIDRSFVQALGEDAEADAIVRSILALSRSLRLDVTAEGVETRAQLDLLRAEDCRQVQGFLLGRPMPREERMVALSDDAGAAMEAVEA